MSSQDKPLENNDNQNESLENSGILHENGSAEMEAEMEAESVTEFISVNSESSEESEDKEDPTPEASNKILSDADFDNIDFRNPPTEVMDESEFDTFLEINNEPAELSQSIQESNLDEPELEIVDVDPISSTDLPKEEIFLEETSTEIGLDNLGDNDFNLDSSAEALLGNLGEIDLESSININNSEGLELEGLDLGELGDLPAVDALNDSALDNLPDDLDSLLDLDEASGTLGSLTLGNNSGLDAIENSLEGDLELSQLDSLLGDKDTAESPLFDKPAVSAKPAKIQSTPKAADPSPAKKSQAFDQTMRVSVRKLDNLNNLIGELVVKRNRLEDDQERLRRFLDNLLGHVTSLGEAGGKMHDLYERSLLEGALIASC